MFQSRFLKQEDPSALPGWNGLWYRREGNEKQIGRWTFFEIGYAEKRPIHIVVAYDGNEKNVWL